MRTPPPHHAPRALATLLLACHLALADGEPVPPLNGARATRTAPPNVLFIIADDLNDWVGCLNGHPQARTPNLDRLAAAGTLFANAHVQSPLCNPSRISLFTGRRPSTTGIYGLTPAHRNVPATRDAVTLPQYFARHGYFTASFGKVLHHDSPADRRHTNEFTVWGPAPLPLLPRKKFVPTPDPEPWMDWGAFPPKDTQQADWKVTDAALAQLKSLPAGQPFFVAVGFRLPHVPCYVSQAWLDQFPPVEKILLPPVLTNDLADVPPFERYLHWRVPEPEQPWLGTSGQWRPLIRAYLASTAFMDSQVGRLLDGLRQLPGGTNTVIVFTSDNGWHLGEKDITGKNTLWERSTRVPLILAGPGVTANARCAQPAELLDLYPTLAELCALPPPDGLEGRCLTPQLRDAAQPREQPAITTHNQGNHALRTDRWRYIRYADGAEELYDHHADPNEWTNLAARAEQRTLVQQLRRWLPATNAPLVPGSKGRVLTQTNGVWCWEGTAIPPAHRNH